MKKKNSLRQFKQLNLFKEPNAFGGSLLVGRRKMQRPLSVKSAIHLVLRSNFRMVFVPGNRSLEKLIQKQAQRFNIRIYRLALNWNHLHVVIKINSREDYVKFIRAFTSIITSKIQKYLKSVNSLKTSEKIFNLRPFTRLIRWGRDFKITMEYQILNQLESLNLIVRPARGRLRKKERR